MCDGRATKAFILAPVLACIALSASAVPLFTVETLGPTEGPYTSAYGLRASSAWRTNAAGQVIGTAVQYSDDPRVHGQGAWLQDGNTTHVIGLRDAAHSRDGDFQYNQAQLINASGQVLGYAERFDPWGLGVPIGTTAWLHDASGTRVIGPIARDAVTHPHFRSDLAQALNEAGEVIGGSYGYDSETGYERASAWLYSAGTTTDLGYDDGAHERADGFRSSAAIALNESGAVLGYSERYDQGAARSGRSSWLYAAGTTRAIGLDDAVENAPVALGGAGRAIGNARSAVGDDRAPAERAWLFDGTDTRAIGLFDEAHPAPGGHGGNEALLLGNDGTVVGYASQRDAAGELLGQTAWSYRDGHATAIGLFDAAHTDADGMRTGYVRTLGDGGHVIGAALRYDSDDARTSASAWVFDGATTQAVPLDAAGLGPVHGYPTAVAERVNAAGLVTGYSSYRPPGGRGSSRSTVWAYASDAGRLHLFDLPDARPVAEGGHAEWLYLDDSGLGLGIYELLGASDPNQRRANFGFTPDYGFFRLDEALDGGLEGNGWTLFDFFSDAAGGRIIGGGTLARDAQGFGFAGVRLTRVDRGGLPSPSTLGLALLALLTVSAVRTAARARSS